MGIFEDALRTAGSVAEQELLNELRSPTVQRLVESKARSAAEMAAGLLLDQLPKAFRPKSTQGSSSPNRIPALVQPLIPPLERGLEQGFQPVLKRLKVAAVGIGVAVFVAGMITGGGVTWLLSPTPRQNRIPKR